jgi:hypothetical protein
MLEHIISAPLRAIIEAQYESAISTIDFLIQLTSDRNGKKIPETIDIAYEQTVHDPDTGELRTETHVMKVPLVTLVPIPYISIEESEIEFDVKILAPKVEKSERLPQGKVRLYAVYAEKQRSATNLSGEMHIKIKAKRSDIPEGLARMLTALNNSVSVVKE